MKKLNLLKKAALALSISAIVIACNKENPKPINPVSAERPQSTPVSAQSNPDPGLPQGRGMAMTTWNGVNACVSPATNCLPEIIITSLNTVMGTYQGEFDDAISAAAVPDFFINGNGLNLFSDLENDGNDPFYNKLVSGDYNVVKQIDGDKCHYLVYDPSSTVDFVLVINNAD